MLALLTCLALAAAPAPAPSAAADAVPLDSLRALVAAERYPAAEALARSVLAAVDSRSPADSVRLGAVLDLLVESLWRGGRAAAPDAASLAARAVALREGRPDALALAHSLHQRANLLRIAGAAEGLQPEYERVLALRRAALGADHPDVARTLNDYGNFRQLTGAYGEAESLFVRSCATYERLGPAHGRNVARCLNNLALLHQARGRYAEARAMFERSGALFERTMGTGHRNTGLARVNLASLLLLTGDVEEARALLEEALVIHERALGPADPDVAWNLRVLAAAYAQLGDTAGARQGLERAIAIHERSLGARHTELGLDLLALAELAERVGDDSAAVRGYRRALEIQEHSLGSAHHRAATARLGLARAEARAGNLAGALALQERALAIREQVFGPDHPDVAEALEALASTRWRLGEVGTALGLALRAEAVTREHLRLTMRTLPERAALELAVARRSRLDLALSIAASDPTGAGTALAGDAAVRARAVVLDEMIRRRRVAVTEPGLAPLAEALAAARERLAHVVVRGPGDGPVERYQRVYAAVRADAERAERALAEASLGFRREEEGRRAGLDDVVRALPRGTALVAYALYDSAVAGAPAAARRRAYLAFVVRADAPPRLVTLGDAAAIDSAIAGWVRELGRCAGLPEWRMRDAEARARALGVTVRRRVWDRVAPHLGGVSSVYVVPDGAVNLVHFGALPAPTGYLVDGAIAHQYLSAERDLLVDEGPARPGARLVAVGAPDYELPIAVAAARPDAPTVPATNRTAAVAPCVSLPAHFPPLVASAREAGWIAERWGRAASAGDSAPRADLRVGAQATEAEFRRLAPGARVIHLATHGFFVDSRCAAPRAPRLPAARPVFAGLAFAGASRHAGAAPEHDGILTAEEIAGLDLGGVEWAVLSACNTGLGSAPAGEGVLGLRRAFAVAGCRSVITSLWPVRDDAAREWMQALYAGRFERRLDTAAAVREASRTLLARRRARGASTHPYDWAGFIAAGGR